MDDLTEKVARAICRASGGCKYFGSKCNTGRCSVSPEQAQAAIRAVLDGMSDEYEGCRLEVPARGINGGTGSATAMMHWTDLIDEMRKRYD